MSLADDFITEIEKLVDKLADEIFSTINKGMLVEDVITGTNSNDSYIISGKYSPNIFYNGLEGTDTITILENAKEFTISKIDEGTYRIKSNQNATFNLYDIENIQFLDKNLSASQIDHVINSSYQVVRASLGPEFLSNKDIINGAASFVQSGMSIFDINQWLVTQNLMPVVVEGQKSDNLSVYNHAFQNVMGRLPEASDNEYWMPFIEENGQARFLTEIASQTENTSSLEITIFRNQDFSFFL